MSETDYNEQRRREAELLVPVGDLEGIGTKIRDRLISADISSVQRLAAATVESLVKIDGIGQKTAETLVERAKEFVAQLEADRELREKADVASRKTLEDEKKLNVRDVFHEDVAPAEEAKAETVESKEEDEKPE